MKKRFILLAMLFMTAQSVLAFTQHSCTGIRARSLQPTFHTTAHFNTGVQRVVWIPIPCNGTSGVRIDASTNPEVFQAFLTAIETNAVITINYDWDNQNNGRTAVTSIVITGY
jgi:hypothetical protein